MGEMWKAVPGYEGLYEVSDQGRVRSVNHTTTTSNGRRRFVKGRILSAPLDKDGYPRVHLCNGTNRKHYPVHRLVALTFLRAPVPGEEVRHLDGMPSHNAASNLSWGTPSDNRRDCYSYGGRTGKGKLFREQVLEIKRRLDDGESKTALAREYQVDFMNIHAISKGTHFSYITGVVPPKTKNE